MSPLEIVANAFNLASIALAGRNNLHTFWTGICGCLLFGWLFFEARLYADVTLQVFFVGSSIVGWSRWRRVDTEPQRGVRLTAARVWFALIAGALASACLYGLALQRFTDAALPYADSIVLTFSVLGQLLLVARRVESWWCWILVNTVAIPLYASRGLHLTAVLYVGFWINAWIALRHWHMLATAI
jgi:nicotinamide mononucleotide transporter